MNSGNARFWTWVVTGLLTVIIAVLVNFLAKLPGTRIDLTSDHRFTLPAAARRVADKLEDTLTINVYLSKGLPTYLSHLPRVVRNQLDEFEKASEGKIHFAFYDPLGDKNLEDELRDLKMTPTSLADFDDGKRSMGNYYLWLEFLYQDQREQFNLASLGQAITDPALCMATLPYQIAARIVKAQHPDQVIGVVSDKKTVPQPRQPRQQQQKPSAGIAAFRKGIESHYPQVRDVNLGFGAPIQDSISTLVLYQPKNLSKRAIYELDQYLMRGHRIVVLLDNYTLFDITKQRQFGMGLQQNSLEAAPTKHGLKEWLGHFGIQLSDGVVEDESCASVVRLMMKPRMGRIRMVQQRRPVHGFVMVREKDQHGKETGEFAANSPVFTGLGMAAMLWPAPMQINREALGGQPGAQVRALIRTSPRAWVRLPEKGHLKVYDDPPKENVSRGSQVLVAEAHGKFKSFFSGKGKPPRQGADGADQAEPPGGKPTLDESAAVGHLWVFADGDFLSDWWRQIISPRQMRGVPSQEATLGTTRMSLGLINAMDAITLGNDLVEIRKPILGDRSLRKQAVEDNKGSIRFWAVLFAPLVLIAVGILNWLLRSVSQHIPSPERSPGKESLLPRDESKSKQPESGEGLEVLP